MTQDTDLRATSFFPATRQNALARLDAFAPQMGHAYARTRNTDFGEDRRDNVSCLSPFHAHRLLLERETIDKALGHHAFDEAEKFIQEVFWRTYFKGWLELRPSVWTRYRQDVTEKLAALKGERKAAYDRAVSGETDIACMNAWARELVASGYLHNHARMWFASIWIFTLKLPWSLGADFFLRHLLDGDAASNTLSWRWVAGLHTRGKNYIARADNIERHTDGRFNPAGQLDEDAAPLEDDWNGKAGDLPMVAAPDPAAPSLLLLHEDDLHWQSLGLDRFNLVGVAGITVTDDRSPLGASEQAKQFTVEAVEDALNRADDALSVGAVKLASPEGLAEHAREIGASQVIYPYAPVGPVQDRLNVTRAEWRRAGLVDGVVLRDDDRAAWPHCSKGFFALKEKIPQLLSGR